MQQRFRKLALFLGAASAFGAGLMVVACGTDNGDSTPVPTVDGSKVDGAKVDGGGENPDEDGGPTLDASTADCANAPKLRPTTVESGFFCPFQSRDAGADASANCASTQTCCNPGIADGGPFSGKFPPSFCADGKGGDTVCAAADEAKGSDYQPGFFSNSWECNDKNGCPAGQICVMITGVGSTSGEVNVGLDTTEPKACNIQKAYKQGGSRCKAPPQAAVDILLCSSDAECGSGTTCKPFDGNNRDLGYCK